MLKKTKYFIFIILLIALVVPKPAFAFIGTGIFDFFDTALEGIEEAAGPITGKIITIAVAYAVGIFALWASSNLLEYVINATDWLSVQTTHPMVQAGFQFTSGLVNMLLILILIIIAFAFIFKLESFQAKKALPRLLIVALLMNFSLVFIGILVDISNVIYNTLLSGNEDLFTQVAANLIGGTQNVLFSMTGWIIALGVGFIVPFVGPFVQLALVAGLLGILTTNIIVWGFQLVALYLLSGVFLAYFVIFVWRVFIIQLLAIISPLAFACLILPQTKKYWDLWLRTLLQWTFAGIVILFVLLLGLSAMDYIMPAAGPAPTSVLGWSTLDDYFKYYLFLTMYLIIALFVSKRTMPAAAQATVNLASGLGKALVMRGVAPASGWLSRKTAIPAMRKTSEKVERLGERIAGREKIARGEKVSGFRRFAGSQIEVGARGTRARVAKDDEKQINEAIQEATNKNSADVINWMREELNKGPLVSKNRLVGFLNGLIKNGDSEDLKEAIEQGKFKDEDIGMIYKAAANRMGSPASRPIAKAFYARMMADPEKFGISTDDSKGRSEYEKLKHKITEKLTAEDISKEILDYENINPAEDAGKGKYKGMGKNALDTILEDRGADLLPQILRRAKRQEREAIWQHLNTKERKWFVEHGTDDILRWSRSTAARNLGLAAIKINGKEVEDSDIKKIRKDAEEHKEKELQGKIAKQEMTDETTTDKTEEVKEKRKKYGSKRSKI